MEDQEKFVFQLLKNEDIRQFYCTELRHLELAAFSVVLSALRAQGGLTEKRKEAIGAVKVALNITDERHLAEIRRVATDERLCRIAEKVAGDSGCLDWNAAGYNDYPLFPHFLQYPADSRRPAPRKSDFPKTTSTNSKKEETVCSPLSPEIIEEQFNPESEGEFLFENGWASDSDVEMEYATMVERAGSDTEEQKEASIRAADLEVAALRRKRAKQALSLKMRTTQTSPDITAVSPIREKLNPDSAASPKKLLLPPPQERGRKRKFAPPVKALGKNVGNSTSKLDSNGGLSSSTSSQSSYETISALASRLGIARGPGRGRGGKIITPRSGRGRGSGTPRGIRKSIPVPSLPAQSPNNTFAEGGDVPLVKETKLSKQNLPPKQRIKIKRPSPEGKPPRKVPRKNKKNSSKNQIDENETNLRNIANGNGSTPRNTFDDMTIDESLQCHESLDSPNPQVDDESTPLSNNNLRHFGNSDAASRLDSSMSGTIERPAPVPSVPVKPPRSRAKGEVPAKMRHKMAKHMFSSEDNRPLDSPNRLYNPLTHNSATNSFSNNFYNEMSVPPPPGINPPAGIRPRMNLHPSGSTSNFGSATIPSNVRSPMRNSLPTPVFSTTLNANSLHKKRTQVLLPSTYQQQPLNSADNSGADGTSATASSLAVAVRNRSSLFDQQRQNIGLALNSIRPLGMTPVPQIQRKAQPHILSSSKLHRPVPLSSSALVLSSTSTLPNNTIFNSTAITSLGGQTGIMPLLTTVAGTTTTSLTSAMTSGLVHVQVPVGSGNPSGSALCNSTFSNNSTPGTSIQNMQTSLQNFQTSTSGGHVLNNTISMPSSTVLTAVPGGFGVNMNVVRGQTGSNIIFLQKAPAVMSGTGAMTNISTANQTTMPPAMQVPIRNTSRAVILRRGNISRPGNVMFVDVHKNQVLGAGQVPQLLQTRIITDGTLQCDNNTTPDSHPVNPSVEFSQS